METQFGRKLEDIELKGGEREAAWRDVQSAFARIPDYFPGGRDGKYLTGDSVSFPDFALCAFLLFIKHISPGPNGAWEKIASWDEGRWGRYVEGFDRWMFVDNHPNYV